MLQYVIRNSIRLSMLLNQESIAINCDINLRIDFDVEVFASKQTIINLLPMLTNITQYIVTLSTVTRRTKPPALMRTMEV